MCRAEESFGMMASYLYEPNKLDRRSTEYRRRAKYAQMSKL